MSFEVRVSKSPDGETETFQPVDHYFHVRIPNASIVIGTQGLSDVQRTSIEKLVLERVKAFTK